MRAAAIAGAVVAAFIGVMYLRFSGDAVPPAEPRPSSAVAARGECVIASRSGGEGPAPTRAGQEPCATLSPLDISRRIDVAITTPAPALPALFNGHEITRVELGEEIDFPHDTAFIVEGGCMQCDPPPQSPVRVYRRPGGEFAVEPLFSPEWVGLGPRQVIRDGVAAEEPPYVVAFAIKEDASDMIAAVCTRGLCGALEPVSEDALTVFFRSTDGGVTWVPHGELDGVAYPVGLIAEGAALAIVHESGTMSFRSIPAGETINPPPVDGMHIWPTVSSGGDIFWNSRLGGTYFSDGATFLPPDAAQGCCPRVLSYKASDRTGVVSVYSNSQSFIADIGPDGKPRRAFSLPPGADAHLYSDSDQTAFGGASVTQGDIKTALPGGFFGGLPAMLDLNALRIRPIAGPFVEPPLMRARKTVYAVQRGPFARVVNTEGICLNIRAEPGSGQVLDCAAEGVLLRYVGQTTDAAGNIWARVATPDGIEGYASTQYLER
jgi:hypothetical protein